VISNLFKKRLATNETQIGCWLMSGSPTCAEAIGWSGTDFTVVDMEHSPIDLVQTMDIHRALSGAPLGVVTRLPSTDPVLVKRVLDIGAQTLMFPMIGNPDEAASAVRSMRYPSTGIRGVAGIQRASRYGALKDYLHECETELFSIAQVEDVRAFEWLDKIAAVEGLSAVFVGPNDLAASMGHLGNPMESDVQDLMRAAPSICHAQGKKIGTLAASAAQANRYVELGYDFVALGSDIGAITSTIASLMHELNRGSNRRLEGGY
jgi:2-keto-3-deoxy-L-rhamnonate aldolase RhmA